jgi:hypothetical protein
MLVMVQCCGIVVFRGDSPPGYMVDRGRDMCMRRSISWLQSADNEHVGGGTELSLGGDESSVI